MYKQYIDAIWVCLTKISAATQYIAVAANKGVFMRHLAIAIAFSVILAGCQTGPQQTNAPLPDEIDITQPPSDVPKEHAEFVGKWQGRWGGTLDSYLVVKSVSDNNADVIYSWGSSEYVPQAGWEPVNAYFRDRTLIVPLNNNPTIEAKYTMTEQGKLDATYRDEGDNVTSEATFVKVGSN